jgi:hypothetical protein
VARTYKHSEKLDLVAGQDFWSILQRIESFLRARLDDVYMGEVSVAVSTEDPLGKGHFESVAEARGEYATSASMPHSVYVMVSEDNLNRPIAGTLRFTIAAIDMRESPLRPRIHINAEGPDEVSVIGITQVALREAKAQCHVA